MCVLSAMCGVCLVVQPPFYNQNLHVMYEKIIRGKLHFPAHLSAEARSVLTAVRRLSVLSKCPFSP